MKKTLLLVCALLLAASAGFAEGWNSTVLNSHRQQTYSFTSDDILGLSGPIDAASCPAAVVAWDAGTSGTAELYACPSVNSTVGQCSNLQSFPGSNVAGAVISFGMPFLKVNRSALPATTATMFIYCGDEPHTVQANPTTVLVLADDVTDSNPSSPTALPGLSFPVLADRLYRVDCGLDAVTDNSVSGIWWSATGPAINWGDFNVANWASAQGRQVNGYTTFSWSQLPNIVAPAGLGLHRLHEIKMLFVPQANGTVQVNVDNEQAGAYTLTVTAGSWCQYSVI